MRRFLYQLLGEGVRMAGNVNINSSGKKVSTAKTDEQAKRLQEIEAKKAVDDAAAAEARAAREAKQAEEAERANAEKVAAQAAKKQTAANREAAEKLGGAVLAVGSVVAGKAALGAKKKMSPKTIAIIVGVIAAIALLLWLAWPRITAALFPTPEPETHVATELSKNAVLTNIKAEMGDAILGEARQKQELVVWEQDVQVESEISKALANIPLFEKTKTIRSFGTGVYTVDMGKIDEASITVDEQGHVVTISIPHTQLQYITKDLEKTEFEDTQHAILGFGDLKLTQEQQNLLERSIEDAMRVELESDECFSDADAAALLVVYDVYQPLIAQVDNTYSLEIAFAD